MAYGFGPSPWAQLPNGNNIWGGDSPPTGSGSNAGFQAGDFLFSTAAPATGPAIWMCTSVTATASVWRDLSSNTSAFKTVSATYALDPVNDSTIIMTGAGAFNVTLPLATAVAVGKTYTVTRSGGANGNLLGAINANGTIGATGAAFGSNPASITVRSDGTQWWMVSSTGTVTVT